MMSVPVVCSSFVHFERKGAKWMKPELNTDKQGQSKGKVKPTNRTKGANMRKHKSPPFDDSSGSSVDGASTTAVKAADGAQESQSQLPLVQAPQEVTSQSLRSKTIPDPKRPFDWRDWLGYWEHLDCSDDQKREVIEAYWLIMVEFMKIKYGLDVSGSKPNVDKLAPGLDLTTRHRTAMVQSKTSQTKNAQKEKDKA